MGRPSRFERNDAGERRLGFSRRAAHLDVDAAIRLQTGISFTRLRCCRHDRDRRAVSGFGTGELNRAGSHPSLNTNAPAAAGAAGALVERVSTVSLGLARVSEQLRIRAHHPAPLPESGGPETVPSRKMLARGVPLTVDSKLTLTEVSYAAIAVFQSR